MIIYSFAECSSKALIGGGVDMMQLSYLVIKPDIVLSLSTYLYRSISL